MTVVAVVIEYKKTMKSGRIRRRWESKTATTTANEDEGRDEEKGRETAPAEESETLSGCEFPLESRFLGGS